MRDLNEALDWQMATADHDYYDVEYQDDCYVIMRSDSIEDDIIPTHAGINLTHHDIKVGEVRVASWVNTYDKFLNELF